MAVISGTVIAIIAGATLLIGGSATAVAYYATEDERNRAKIEKLEQDNSNCNKIINHFSKLKEKLKSGKSYLNDPKEDFAAGGHSLDGEPLANSEFKSCISKIDNAIDEATNIINSFEAKVEKNKREIRILKNKIESSNDAMAEASKKQYERRERKSSSSNKPKRKHN